MQRSAKYERLSILRSQWRQPVLTDIKTVAKNEDCPVGWENQLSLRWNGVMPACNCIPYLQYLVSKGELSEVSQEKGFDMSGKCEQADLY